ncbi:hypothetical protein [Microtetraspora sp. AC03309]|nr:hypothetical protein [Microtetraspora sp. AC03309]
MTRPACGKWIGDLAGAKRPIRPGSAMATLAQASEAASHKAIE